MAKTLPLAVWSLRQPIFGFASGISWSSRRPIFGFASGSLCSAVVKFFLIRKATHQPHEPYQTPTPQLESPRAYSAIRHSPFSASPEHNPPNHPCEKQTHYPPLEQYPAHTPRNRSPKMDVHKPAPHSPPSPKSPHTPKAERAHRPTGKPPASRFGFGTRGKPRFLESWQLAVSVGRCGDLSPPAARDSAVSWLSSVFLC